VFDYEPLARRLDGRRTVHAIQSRMLLDPLWQDSSLEEMARDYVGFLRSKQAQGPYHLLGWSLGGALAVLMAAELERQGQEVRFLGLLDPFVPSSVPAGVPAGAVDDWCEDLRGFVAVMLPWAAGTEPPGGGESPEAVRSFLAAAVAMAPEGTAGYAAMGVEELAHVFEVARRLKRLSTGLPACPPIRAEPACWWVPGRDGDRRALEAQLGHRGMPAHRLACGHFEAPRARAFLDRLEETLEGVPGDALEATG
jgi:thioesterase domain-containing protein